ncbi:formylglycine-generating enzyme family protein [Humisphaera borealis]|uniref:SUMF1/EgtB/PvdO family nonheme iron enzyme n=1 Tax=Humisphaera borealis TaxID=2807512 RepID=A0A7M2WY38_9BACT|nr:formylglycine-generating enzyme family protein [Humisphaera borealis]QOV90142.1 SUMF1/EgtB/PvdO family nonheme iron enzyme [Humisphaera borealis]
MTRLSSKRSNPLSKAWLGRAACAALAVAAAAAALPLAVSPAPARAETPAVPADMKPFTQSIVGLAATFDMVPIPGGTVTVGSPESEKKRNKAEGPQFDVEVEPFYMGKYEMTWDIYNEYLAQYPILGEGKGKTIPFEKQADAVSYPTPIYDIEAGPALQRMGGREGKLPAVIMSQFAAKQFTKWLSAKTGRFYRLPTEAEWEFAARAGTKTAYFFGDDAKKLDDYAWHYDNSALSDGEVGYHKVGGKKPNPFGLYDIYGNVAEIVVDQYDDAWYAKFAGKKVGWREALRWPDSQYPRLARGGGYESDVENCRSAARQKITVNDNKKDPQIPKSPYWWTEGFSIGFRVVSPVKEPSAEEKNKFWNVDNESTADVLKRDREIRQLVEEITGPKAPK